MKWLIIILQKEKFPKAENFVVINSKKVFHH